MQICDGARDWCDLVWLVDANDPSVPRVRPILRKFGVVVDALGDSPEGAAKALAVHAPSGLATFYDTGMEHVAAIAEQLEVSFHSAHTARCLEDKLHQRTAFRAAGLAGPEFAGLPPHADRETLERIADSIGLPAVLKPRRASGSWHTCTVTSVSELCDRVAQLAPGEAEAMLLEGYLPDGPAMPGGFEADYVSVETIAHAGAMTHLAITGRFPPAPPFRETGFFIPATVGPGGRSELLDLAGEALRALGVRSGPAHTEIKLTADGPRVLEVNGRVGGGVPDMLRLATGVEMVRLAMRAALGLTPDVDALPATNGVAYRFFYQPPENARRLISIDGLERLKQLSGVESLFLHHLPGTEIDARDGTRCYLFAVVGSAADYPGVLAVQDFMRTEIAAAYEYV
jgi:biotin carboxylase